MNIFIISQDLESGRKGDDRLFKLGREMTSRGHTVTTLTSSGAVELELGRKKLGLVQKNGLSVIAFNLPTGSKMSLVRQMWVNLKFARLVEKQGRSLPRPDLIVVKAPPLAAGVAAVKMSEYYRVPLVAEFRELWPGALIEQGRLRNRVVINAMTSLERKIYAGARLMIALDQAAAGAIRANGVEQDRVSLVEDCSDEKLLIEAYDRALTGLGLELDRPRGAVAEK